MSESISNLKARIAVLEAEAEEHARFVVWAGGLTSTLYREPDAMAVYAAMEEHRRSLAKEQEREFAARARQAGMR